MEAQKATIGYCDRYRGGIEAGSAISRTLSLGPLLLLLLAAGCCRCLFKSSAIFLRELQAVFAIEHTMLIDVVDVLRKVSCRRSMKSNWKCGVEDLAR